MGNGNRTGLVDSQDGRPYQGMPCTTAKVVFFLDSVLNNSGFTYNYGYATHSINVCRHIPRVCR